MIESKHEIIFFGDSDTIDLGVVFPLIRADIRIILLTFLALHRSIHRLYHVLSDALLAWAPV